MSSLFHLDHPLVRVGRRSLLLLAAPLPLHGGEGFPQEGLVEDVVVVVVVRARLEYQGPLRPQGSRGPRDCMGTCKG